MTRSERLFFSGIFFVVTSHVSMDAEANLEVVRGMVPKEIVSVHHRVYSPAKRSDGGYNHHAKVGVHEGSLHVIWANSKTGEDAPGQRVLYSRSTNGVVWSAPIQVGSFELSEGPYRANGRFSQPVGFLKKNDGLYIVQLIRDRVGYRRKEGPLVESPIGARYFSVSSRQSYIINKVLSSGQLGPDIFLPPDISGADRARLGFGSGIAELLNNEICEAQYKNTNRRLSEPQFVRFGTGLKVCLFRDDDLSHKLYLSFSVGGKKWSMPEPSDITDSPSLTEAMMFGGNKLLLIGNHWGELSEGDYFIERRFLTLLIIDDSLEANRFYIVKDYSHNHRISNVPGRGTGGAQYPSAVIRGDSLIVAYSSGKEDIWIAKIPLEELAF